MAFVVGNGLVQVRTAGSPDSENNLVDLVHPTNKKMENQGCTFKVDELELVSFLRNGRGALEEQVDVDWDPTR